MTVLKTGHIAPYHLVSLYLLCRSAVFWTLPVTNGEGGLGAAVGSLLSELLIPVLLLPGFVLLRRYPGDTIAQCGLRLLPRWAGQSFGWCCLLFLLLSTALWAGQFQLFSSASLYDAPSGGAVLLAVLSLGVFGALQGLEALGRFAFPAAVLLGGGFLLTVILGLFRASPVLLTPLTGQAMEAMPLTVCRETGRGTDGLLLLFLLPELKTGQSGAYALGPLLCGGSGFLRRFVEFGVLGAMGAMEMYPFFLVTRWTGLFVSLWVLGALVRFALYFAVMRRLIFDLLPSPARTPVFFCAAAVCGALGLWLSGAQGWMELLLSVLETGIPMGVLGLLVPVILLARSDGRRQREQRVEREAVKA